VKNLGDMMKQARELQSRLSETQAELEAMEIEGVSGGGLVRVTLSGKGEMRAMKVDDSLFTSEEKAVLEDLVMAAHNDAKTKLEAATAEKMRALTGGLPLPPGFNFGGA